MAIKPQAITYIKKSMDWRFSIELFDAICRIVAPRKAPRAGRTSAGMSTVNQSGSAGFAGVDRSSAARLASAAVRFGCPIRANGLEPKTTMLAERAGDPPFNARELQPR